MESRLIHNILDHVPGVLSVDVMVVTKMVTVHHDPAAISPAALVAALNSAGLQASLNKHSTSGGAQQISAGGSGLAGTCSSSCCGTSLPTSSTWQRSVQQRGLIRLLAAIKGNPSLPPLSVLASALLLVINLLLLLPGLHAPYILQKGLLALIAAAVAVPPVLKKAWHGLQNRNLDMNSLVSGWASLQTWQLYAQLLGLYALLVTRQTHAQSGGQPATTTPRAPGKSTGAILTAILLAPVAFVLCCLRCAVLCCAGGGGLVWCHRPW